MWPPAALVCWSTEHLASPSSVMWIAQPLWQRSRSQLPLPPGEKNQGRAQLLSAVGSLYTLEKKNHVKRMAFDLILVKCNLYRQHSKMLKENKFVCFSQTYLCSQVDVHEVIQVLLLPGISHKRKIKVKWQTVNKRAPKVKEYSHLCPHSLYRFWQALM